MAVPYTFQTATGSIPLSQLDSNFSTAITIGNTAVVLGDSISTINNLSLANVSISSVATAFPNGYLANSNVIVGTTTLTLGSTVTTIDGLTLGNVTIASGNVTISNVTVSNFSATTANVSGTANISNLVVIGNETVGGNTTVTGNITASKGTFTSANVTGTANVQVIAVTQNATVAGNATVTGNVSAANGTFTSANVSGTANVSTLAVVINATIGGNATVTGNVTAAKLIPTGTSVTGNGLYLPAANSLGLSTNGTNAVYIDSSQNVGIGTASPTEKLTIAGIGRVTGGNGFNASGPVQAGNQYYGWEMYNVDSSTNYLQGYNRSTSAWMNNVYTALSHQWHTSGSEKMRIDSSGNVGIGTTTAVGRLTSEFNTSGTVTNTLTLNNNAGGAGNGVAINFYASNASQPFTGRINSLDDGNFGYHTVFSNKVGGSSGAGALTERMRIDSSGNLLVGTTTVKAKQTVVAAASSGNGYTAGFYNTWSGDVSFPGLYVAKYDNNSTTSQILVRFTINNDGVGQGQINANGANAAAFGSFSDSRLKENITDLPSQLANIMALRPVEYDYIESEGGGHQIGFVAQEVQEIYPDLVGERADGMLTLSDMNKNDARLIKCIQEQQAIITALTARITALENK